MKSFSFFKGLSLLIFLNLLVKPAWIFLIDRQVQNTVGFDVYGKYFAVLNLSLILFSIADAGLSTMLNQRMAHQLRVNVPQLLRLKLLLIILYASACFMVAWLTQLTNWQLLFYVVLIQVLTSFFIFLRSIITAHQFFSEDAWFSIVDKLLMILLMGTLLYVIFSIHIDLRIFLQVQLFCSATSVLLAFYFIIKKRLILQPEKETIHAILTAIWPFATVIFLMSVHYRLDGFLLERIHASGAKEAGTYAAAYRLLDAGNMVGYLAASFLVPFIARQQLDKNIVNKIVLTTRHGLMFLAMGIVSFTVVFAPWIQQMLYHSADPYLSLVMTSCMASLPAYYLVHIYGSMLTATGRLKSFLYILVVSVVINLTLNLFLIPVYGAFGCCIAALSSQYFCGIATFIVTTKKCKMAYGQRSLIAYLTGYLFLVGAFYGLKMVIPHVWIILVMAVLVCILAFATQLGFFKKYFVLLR